MPSTEAEWEEILSQPLPPLPAEDDPNLIALNTFERGQEPWRQIRGLKVNEEPIVDAESVKAGAVTQSRYWAYHRRVR